jgi:hypothetical protein
VSAEATFLNRAATEKDKLSRSLKLRQTLFVAIESAFHLALERSFGHRLGFDDPTMNGI